MSTSRDHYRNNAANTAMPEFPTTAFNVPPPLSEARVAIVTTGGLTQRGQAGWERGEQSFRVLDAAERDLQMGHWSINYDRTGFSADINVVYPIDRLKELAAEGIIGSVAPRHLSFMGALDDTMATLRLDSGRAAAKLLRDDGVQVVLLTGV
jgi:D-proline reductase (dithiol) PrdB